MTTHDEDYVKDVFIASTHHYILIFTEKGKLFWLKVYDIPEQATSSLGQAIVNLVPIDEGDAMATAVATKDFPEDQYLVMVTQKGFIKKTQLSEFSSPRSNGIIALSVDSSDRIKGVSISNGSNEIILATRSGKAIRFSEEDVRPMGRTARGVKAINLKKDDLIMGMSIPSGKENALLTLTERGFGKRTRLEEYSAHSRGGSGMININVTKRNGAVVEILLVKDEDEFLLISASGKTIRIKTRDVPIYGRNTQGVRIIELGDDDSLVGAAKVTENI
jgi:DNA gyrase subunit A